MWHTCWRCFRLTGVHGKRVPDSVTKEKITELIELAAANFGVARGKISEERIRDLLKTGRIKVGRSRT